MYPTKFQILLSILIGIFALFVISCEHDMPQFDEEAPRIQIISPRSETSFEVGEQIVMELELQENNELHEFSAVLRGQDVDTAFTIMSGHLHDAEISMQETFELPLESGTYKLTVKANDHDGNIGTESIIIYSK